MKMNKQGFTLIEILVVVAIISVLIGSVLVGLGPAQRQGRDTRRVSDLRQVQNALELYYSKCGFYPGTANCGGSGTVPTGWSGLSDALTGTTGLGINQIPDDPNTSQHYIYGSTASTYTLAADLEDANNPALNSSPKTTINGVDCSVAKRYCVQF